MSGSGRKSHYRKSVQDSFLNGFLEPEENDSICRVTGSRGTNLFELELSGGGGLELAMLPNKFKKLIWVRRGDFVIAASAVDDCTTATGEDVKVKYMIKHILSKEQIKHIVDIGIWPEDFEVKEAGKKSSVMTQEDLMPDYDSEEDYEEDDDESGLKVDSMGNYVYPDDDNEEEGECES
ncbi:eif1ad [Symbiodinium microadriaticum]|nr:eif1ad [Symbiodinium microadriaticum]